VSEADSRDAEAFRALFERNARAVLGYALRRVDDPADAADVLAESFLVAWRRLGDVPAGDGERGWLLGVARRVLANQRRGELRRRHLGERLRVEVERLVPAGSGVVDDMTARVHQALARLSEEDRELVLLAAWEGLEPRELARVLGIRTGAARTRLHRARRRLRAELVSLGWPETTTRPRLTTPLPLAVKEEIR
jgi:RNA polymerase sigma factor (sigma-70 family)